jgi:hypothetical protein
MMFIVVSGNPVGGFVPPEPFSPADVRMMIADFDAQGRVDLLDEIARWMSRRSGAVAASLAALAKSAADSHR